MVRLVVIQIRLISNQRESGHPDIVKGRIITSVIAFHPRLDQTQVLQGRQGKIDCLTRCVVLVKAQRQNSGCASIVSPKLQIFLATRPCACLTYSRDPISPCSSPVNKTILIVRLGRKPTAFIARIASITDTTPVPSSFEPDPKSQGIQVRTENYDLHPVFRRRGSPPQHCEPLRLGVTERVRQGDLDLNVALLHATARSNE